MTEPSSPGADLPWLEYDAGTGRLRWADTLAEWHSAPGSSCADPSWELMEARRHPQDALGVATAVQRCLADGTPVSELHRIADGDGGWRWVVLTAVAGRDDHGAVTRLSGHLVDVTARQRHALAEWATAAVDATTQSRAVIDQAKGALMLTYGLDADTAFGLLVWQSRHTNVKLRELAARLVAAARGNPDSAVAVRARLDEIFYDAAFPGTSAAAPVPAEAPTRRHRPRASPTFEVRETQSGGARVLALRGDIDLATAPGLDLALGRAISAEPPAPVVVDLREVRHLGSFGVGVLVTHHRRAVRADVPLHLVVGPGPVRALLALLAPGLPVGADVT